MIHNQCCSATWAPTDECTIYLEPQHHWRSPQQPVNVLEMEMPAELERTNGTREAEKG